MRAHACACSPYRGGLGQVKAGPQDGARAAACTAGCPVSDDVEPSPGGTAGRRAGRDRARPTAPGGTPRPRSTTPSTAPSSATPTSSGAPRACARPSPTCSATSTGRRVLEIGAGAGQCSRWAGRRAAPRSWPPTCPRGMLREGLGSTTGSTRHRAAGAARPVRRGRPAVRRRQLRPGLHGVRRGAVRRRLGRGDARGAPGCCGRAAGSSSRPPTRSGGRCPTTRARRA